MYYQNTSRVFTTEELNGGKISKPKYQHHSDMKAFFKEVDPVVNSVIAMSDIHSVTTKTIDSMIKKKVINKNVIVITTGDMAGTGKSGPAGDANPYDDYVKILKHCYRFYFVQGNHDIYDKRVFELVNTDGVPCYVHNQVVQTPIGTIAGVSGIVVPDDKVDKSRHKYSNLDYSKWITNLKKQGNIDVMLTHMPPADDALFVPIHMFGHCHEKQYYYHRSDSLCLNMDSRVIKFV